jgi:biotin carboxyl carrier protein
MPETIRSPLPGTFYRRPSPEEPPFKEVGDSVAEGDTIGLVEVMKSFHPVEATATGKVASFEVEDGDAVTAGQDLATVEA